MLSARILCVVAAFALTGCGGGGSGGGTPTPAASTAVVIDGAVQKGPFIVGSTVLINRLDDRGNSTSSTTLAKIEDSIGSFSFSTTERGPVQIVATGYYFSELTGQISDGVLTLRGLYEVSDDSHQVAHVNILTHLINDRVLKLLSSDGQMTLHAAIVQAENELVAAFADTLGKPDLNGFSALSLYDSDSSANNTLGNAYLIALSAGFYKYAKTKGQQFGTATDAELTLVLNSLSNDLADDGHVSNDLFMDDFVTAIRSLNPETIVANLHSRSLVDYPKGLGVPDISVFLDLCAGTADCPWRAGAPMPYASTGQAAAVYDGKVYVLGGGHPIYGGDGVRAYDPVTNEWTAKRSMPKSTRDIAAHTIGDKIYAALGQSGLTLDFQNEFYAYDPLTDQWSARAPRPTYRASYASAVVNGLLYIIGGRGFADDTARSSAQLVIKSHVEIYNPATDQWSTGAPMPIALQESRACVFDDQIYVFGGTHAGEDEVSILTYDTQQNSWSAKSPMPNIRSQFACAVVDGAVYLLGGWTLGQGTMVDAVDRYDLLAETWTSPTRIKTPRYGLSAAVVGSKIITLGGSTFKTNIGELPTDVVEILNTGGL